MDNKQEMPIGFSLSLGMNSNALNYFSTLDEQTKIKIKNYLQNTTTGNDALEKNNKVIECLNNNNLDFLN